MKAIITLKAEIDIKPNKHYSITALHYYKTTPKGLPEIETDALPGFMLCAAINGIIDEGYCKECTLDLCEEIVNTFLDVPDSCDNDKL